MDEVVRDFLVESSENLDVLDRELVRLEQDSGNHETLASIFRTIHTIKGTCGFLGFTKLESVAHVGENLLSRLRDGEITLSPEITTALLTLVDAIRQMLASIEAKGNEGERNDEQLIARLTELQGSSASTATSGKTITPQPHSEAPDPHTPMLGEILIEKGVVTPRDLASAAQSQQEGDPRHIGEILVEQGAAKSQDVLEALKTQQSAHGGVSDGSIRVDVGLLDKLMNLVGELVLARNQVLQFTHSTEDTGLLGTSQRLNLITTELQEGVMKTRMQPIGNIWSKFPRTVRDVALACGKQVRIEMEGKDTELDKTIIEAIKDPLTHLVRNAVDHGIERPEQRTAAGKAAEGCLSLRAFHEGGQVIIEISDDGAGLNCEKIRRKAMERGVITSEQAARMTDREVMNLIFLPGFSTAERVTNVSGRGVGMDVVKTQIEKIGGTVDVQSELGARTTIRMKIPLTLAIIPALIVSTSGDRYAIPQVSLLELVRVEAEDAQKRIEMVHGAPVHRLRGRLLPLVYLNRELQVTGKLQDAAAEATNIVVLQADDRQFGLVVDEINDTEEIVVKPLSQQLKGINTFAGATIMGDGRVALILDVLGLAQRASVVTEARDRTLTDKHVEQQERSREQQTFLLFAGPDDARMALPLSTLARLEEFPRAQVERSGSQWVAQYRGEILDVIHLGDVLEERREHPRHVDPAAPADLSAALQVVVCAHEGRRVGLVVERILDIVDDDASVKCAASRQNVLYSAVINGRVTEILDIPAILHTAEQSRSVVGEPVEVAK